MSLISLSPFDLNSASFRSNVFAMEYEVREYCTFVIRDTRRRISPYSDYFLAIDGSEVDDYQLLLESISESSNSCLMMVDWSDSSIQWREGSKLIIETPHGERLEQENGESPQAFRARIHCSFLASSPTLLNLAILLHNSSPPF